MTRAQANLPAFAIAVLVVTSTATLAILLADSAFAATDREPAELARAAGLADRMVAADGPLTVRANVLDGDRLTSLDDRLHDWFSATVGVGVRVTLGDRVLVSRGDPTGGTTVRRLVLLAESTPRTLEPAFTGSDHAITLPRRATSVELRISPPDGTTVSTVWVNDRVVLHDPEGLAGTYTVALSRFETARIRFGATGALPQGSVRLTYQPDATRKAVLGVTVDA